MYNIGTVTTTANSPKITGTGTRWKDNTTLISVGQVVLIENGSNLLINSIYSIESNTALTLAFPISAKLTNAKYIILTTMIDSISDGVNKATAQVIASEVYTEILNQWMTAQGTIDVELPTGQKIKLRTVAEMDKQLDGKLNSSGNINLTKGVLTIFNPLSSLLRLVVDEDNSNYISFFKNGKTDSANRTAVIGYGDKDIEEFQITNSKVNRTIGIHRGGVRISGKGEILTAGEFGFGGSAVITLTDDLKKEMVTKVFKQGGGTGNNIFSGHGAGINFAYTPQIRMGLFIRSNGDTRIYTSRDDTDDGELKMTKLYSEVNTTKDANGNLKAASPVVKLFADDIELNDESEGVEMEHLGIGHYLIKGVVGFNADGAWGINNGFVIPQDHNGKNMVLIDYEVRVDGDIEVFVFHQQNAEMPERFQNKRIKHFDEEGVPVYFENYEPCDVPESRWIDMRVEMPPNSLYNQKQAEAERLAKIEAERLEQEEAKRIAEEAERAEQEAAERKSPTENNNIE